MSFCLPQYAAEELRTKLANGELKPSELSKMTSEERRAAFGFLGDDATRVNALFESKLILKNQQKGFETWARQVFGDSPKQYKDVMSAVERLGDKILTPSEKEAFMQDLIAMRTGLTLKPEEAARLLELQKKVEAVKANLPPKVQEFINKPGATKEYLKNESPSDLAKRLEYGDAMVEFKNYVEELHPKSKPQTLKDFAKTPIISTLELAKTLRASWDNSFWGNQGITTLLNPRNIDLWVKGVVKSFGDIGKVLKGGSALDAIRAEVYSRPDAINGTYGREGLALGLRKEEALPSTLPERIPVLNRLFKASSEAYSGAALRLRADLADRINSVARKQGRDLTNKDFAKDVGAFVNNATGRGSLGSSEGSLRALNAIAFSPRLLASTWRNLFSALDRNVDPFVRKQSAIQLASMGATFFGLMQTVEMMNPGSTDLDPRSAHFGQVNVGDNTWVNTMGPYRTLIRAMAQLIPTYHNGALGFWRRTSKGQWQRQQIFGKVPEFGAYTPLDAAEGFLEGKASPGLAALIGLWRGSQFDGTPNTPGSLGRSLTVPMTLDQVLKATEDDPAMETLIRDAVMAGLGFNTTDYTKKK